MTVWQTGLCREKVAEYDDMFFEGKGFQTVPKLIEYPERYYASYCPATSWFTVRRIYVQIVTAETLWTIIG